MPERDRFGFQFWLFWILSFAGSFLISAGFWTFLIGRVLGDLSEPEILVTWALSVFGSWFLILTPFMRKKERIWKRLNTDEEKAVDVWLAGMGLFVALLIAACFFWSWKMRAQIFETRSIDGLWARNVFATWLAVMMPFLIFLYKRADQIYQAAVKRQKHLGPKFQTAFLDQSKRKLAADMAQKLKSFPETLHDGHVVNVLLKDGRKIPDVFVFRGDEILGIYNAEAPSFEAQDIADIEPVESLPAYDESKWLRLDGRA
jgi:hypothetical protein